MLTFIPTIGLFLRDLTLNSALPTFLDPTNLKIAASVDSVGSLEVVVDPDALGLPIGVSLSPLVNVQKIRKMSRYASSPNIGTRNSSQRMHYSSIVQQVLAFKELAEIYPFVPESSIYFKCLKVRSIPTAAIMQCSLRIEP